MKALIMSADGFEDSELLYPLYRLKEEGYDVVLAAPEKRTITGKHSYTVSADMPISKVNPKDYDLLVLPGGKGPEEVRLEANALKIVKHFFDMNKPVASICHGPQVLISAGVLEDRKATCWKGIKDDIIAAGARYDDKEVVVDGNLVTSRMPSDLPAFMRETIRIAGEKRATKVGKKAA